jgi:hypothetical protein
MVASTSPALTWSPTLTLSDVRVPLESKLSLADVTADVLPDADTLSWTVPLVTVTVRATPGAADDVP